LIRLEHVFTQKRLHSHDVRPPITEADWQNEVSAYGFPGFEGDANDYFRVEIVKDETPKGVARERLRYWLLRSEYRLMGRAIDTKFRLVHYITGCVLFSHKVKVLSFFNVWLMTSYRNGALDSKKLHVLVAALFQIPSGIFSSWELD